MAITKLNNVQGDMEGTERENDHVESNFNETIQDTNLLLESPAHEPGCQCAATIFFKDLLRRSMEVIATSVNEVKKELQEMKETNLMVRELKETVNGLSSTSTLIQSSLKMLEVVVCTGNHGATNKGNDFVKDHNENDVSPIGGTVPLEDAPDSLGSAQKRKSQPAELNEDELANVLLALSEEEDENEAKKLRRASFKMDESINICKPQLPSAWTTQHVSGSLRNKGKDPADMSILKSDFNIRGKDQQLRGESSGTAWGHIAKKLFQSPSPTSMSTQGRTCQQLQHLAITGRNSDIYDRVGTTIGKGRPKVNEGRHGPSKVPGMFIPKGTKMKFRPTNDMHLDLCELQASVLLFHHEQDPGEILVMARNLFGTRTDFESLCPGRHVSSEIIALACEKTRWVQKNYNINSVWSLPPSFAEDVFLGSTLYDLMDKYGKEWMDPFSKLKYIYVPIKNGRDHFYLMVVSLDDKTIYHVDSFLTLADVVVRQQRISALAEVLSQMVGCSYYGSTFVGRSVNFGGWPVKEARGIPNCGKSDNSGVWVLQWLDMEQNFDPDLTGLLDENFVRMKTATTLLLGLHNELRNVTEEKANLLWDTLPHY